MYLKGGDNFIMRESPLFRNKNFTPLAIMVDTYFTLGLFKFGQHKKQKKLTVTNGLFFIYDILLFYIWLIFSRHKMIDTKNKIQFKV